MSDTKVKINSIELTIGKDKIKLTVEEARELNNILNDLFGKPESIPYSVPYPVYVEKEPWKPYPYWRADVWYGNNTDDNGIFKLSLT